jgi:hypothetical protein
VVAKAAAQVEAQAETTAVLMVEVQVNNQVNQANQVTTVMVSQEVLEAQLLVVIPEAVAAVVPAKQVNQQLNIGSVQVVEEVQAAKVDNQMLQVHKYGMLVAEEAVAAVSSHLKVPLQEAKVEAVTEIQDQEEQMIIQDNQTQVEVPVVVMMLEVQTAVQVS